MWSSSSCLYPFFHHHSNSVFRSFFFFVTSSPPIIKHQSVCLCMYMLVCTCMCTLQTNTVAKNLQIKREESLEQNFVKEKKKTDYGGVDEKKQFRNLYSTCFFLSIFFCTNFCFCHIFKLEHWIKHGKYLLHKSGKIKHSGSFWSCIRKSKFAVEL